MLPHEPGSLRCGRQPRANGVHAGYLVYGRPGAGFAAAIAVGPRANGCRERRARRSGFQEVAPEAVAVTVQRASRISNKTNLVSDADVRTRLRGTNSPGTCSRAPDAHRSDDPLRTSPRNSLEPRVGAQCVEHSSHVVPNRLASDAELVADLLGRASGREQHEHLALSRSERRGRGGEFVDRFDVHEPEDAECSIAIFEPNGVELGQPAFSVAVKEDRDVAGRSLGTGELSRELLPNGASRLRSDHGRVVVAAPIAERLDRSDVQPPDPPSRPRTKAGRGNSLSARPTSPGRRRNCSARRATGADDAAIPLRRARFGPIRFDVFERGTGLPSLSAFGA